MLENLEVTLEKATAEVRKPKPDGTKLGFGQYFTDHMFLMKWNMDSGWHNATICPYEDFHLDPAAMVFHYGQAIFEGMKAYRGKDDQLYLFRPQDNFERMNKSAARMCMPRFPVDQVLNALRDLLSLDCDWVPQTEGASLYIRPTMIAVDPVLSVKPAQSYYFYIILSPVGSLYAEGFQPTKIYVSEEYVRAVKGGVGATKTAGNYAASLYMSEIAKKEGYTQVLWLDACEHRYIEEIGTSNIFFVIDDTLVTPPLEGSILGGITRDSVLKMAKSWGMTVSERRVSIDEVLLANRENRLQEAFGSGTAAVISPVGEFFYKGEQHQINEGKLGKVTERLYQELLAIQRGYQTDQFNWVVRV